MGSGWSKAKEGPRRLYVWKRILGNRAKAAYNAKRFLPSRRHAQQFQSITTFNFSAAAFFAQRLLDVLE
jgi:hypothetical protein